MLGMDAAIDLGTSNIRIFVNGKGILVDEPSVIAVDNYTDTIVAMGKEAYDMLGKTSNRTSVIYPLMNGVISDFYLVEQLVGYFLKKVNSNVVVMPRVVACIPGEITEVEKRAVVNSISSTGVRKICLIEEPVAAALGAGIDIFAAHGSIIVNIGGGTTDTAVISLSGVSAIRSLKIAGNTFDEAIVKYVKKSHNLVIGKQTAERAKKAIAYVYPQDEKGTYVVKGRNALSGLPQAVEITSEEIFEAIVDPAMQIARTVQDVLEEAPPELLSDIYMDGIMLTGGSAHIRGFDKLISKKTKLNVTVAEDPENCVVLGAGRSLKYIDKIINREYGIMNPLSAEY